MGLFTVAVSSQTFANGEALSQAIVGSARGGSGLIAFDSARTPLRFKWKSDYDLVVSYPNDMPPQKIEANHLSFAGRGRVKYQAVARNEIPELRWTRQLSREHSVPEVLERGELIAIEEKGKTIYSYVYYDTSEPDSSAQALEERGFQGGGYTWAGIINGLVALRAPQLEQAISLDPEGDGLSVVSTNREALLQVAELVAAAKKDPALLDQAIARAEVDGMME